MDKEAVITPEIVRQLLDYDPDTGTLTWRARSPKDHPNLAPAIVDMFNTNWAGKAAGSTCSQGYTQVKITLNGHPFVFKGHRLAWVLHHGQWPRQEIDHINGRRSDNRIENLRDVSALVNSRNRSRHPKNTSGHWGVRWTRGAWEAKFRTSTANHYMGRFPKREDAIAAVRAKAKELGLYTDRHGVG